MPTAKKTNVTKEQMAKESKEELLEAIDEAVHPDKMSKREALDFLEELMDDVSVRCEALREEVDDERETSDE